MALVAKYSTSPVVILSSGLRANWPCRIGVKLGAAQAGMVTNALLSCLLKLFISYQGILKFEKRR